VFPRATATVSQYVLQIVTPGLGTSVKVTGMLAGDTVNIVADVRRDAAVCVLVDLLLYRSSYIVKFII